ncbi:NADH:ubiquinone oxidoreductase subunit 5 (chain L)/multisubunit Na+/H+ antiporter, MnhA subunit [Thiovulum sp. ES]|nr:NADH:ubiquinone oxidoreductase subunit 5 (chain L)/multisubunit Na+/H+ antiporter, MnhA subunit [Thiovulum sp. ES]
MSLEILIVLLPFIGAVLTFFAGNRFSFWVGYAFGLALFSSVVLLFWNYTNPITVSNEWIAFGNFSIPLGLYIDKLSLVMLLIATGLGFLDIHFSKSYMAEEPEQRRYHSKVLFFIGGMVLLVTGGDMISVFFGWELMGLASYLLISFWHTKSAPADAGQQAFLYTRFGDIFLFASIGLLFYFGGSLNLIDINNTEMSKDVAFVIAVFIFIASIGKSGQFPLFPWLMNAMEGPTTVSALIHGATMVNSGIYIVARLFDFYSYAEALPVVLAIASLSAFIGATSAIVQREMKKALAYSTMSHLSLAFAGLGAGLLSAGVGHLINHAVFKALLFLGFGAVILIAHHQKDVWKLGGIGKHTPILAGLIAIAGLSLSGVPPFGGFHSKDSVLFGADEVLVTIAGLLSVVYISRIWILAFTGEQREKIEIKKPSPFWILLPLGIMATATTLMGIFYEDILHFLNYHSEHPPVEFQIVAVASILFLGYATFKFYSNLEMIHKLYSQPFLNIVHKVLYNGYYVQAFITFVSKNIVVNGISKALFWSDRKVVDGAVNKTVPISQNIFVNFTKVESLNGFWIFGIAIIILFTIFK